MATIALTFGTSSCSNDNDASFPVEGEKAMLSIQLDAPTLSRASGTVPTDKVGDYTVFITDKSTGDINTAWTKYNSDGTALTGDKALGVTTNAQHVYIVANGGDLSSITTLAALKAYKADLNGTGAQSSATNRWATGATASALSFTNSGDGEYKANATVTLTFIAARITVTVDNAMTKYGEPGSLTLNSIAVLNARGESLLFPSSGTSLIPSAYTGGKKFYTGYDKPSGETWSFWPTAGTYTVAAARFLDALNLAAPSTTYYYYVFENDATTANASPTIVTLTGKDKDGKNLYWPVHLASYEQWKSGSGSVSSITRGKSYNINIKLTGDATKGGGGTTDPTDPVVNGTVEVSVTVPSWEPVVLNKEF
ncbi:DUF4906 domain-containing protein, partial [Bacteroides sp. 51]|uniref:DUF4906 domain-containing protein n=1 Tax=Bacteroides sp. 51 TaxID=2302938 RepID=UPI0013D3A4C3